MKNLMLWLLMVPLFAAAASAATPPDRAPIDPRDKVSLQRGARNFVNYCLNCHSAAYMRYSRLEDLDLTEQQIKDYLLLAGDKVGETMTVSMDKKDAKDWFGATPPDLSVIARSRGADWLYSYLRSFYRDDSRPTGWNNLIFDKVGMPHVLYQLQGIQVLEFRSSTDHEGRTHVAGRLALEQTGAMPPKEFNSFIADLVNFLAYMGEPAKTSRIQIGIVVLFFLALLFLLALFLKKEYWKDIRPK